MIQDLAKYEEVAEVLKALAHPIRLCIVNAILGSGECNVSHMQGCLDVPQSTISQHLQKLRTAGIVESKRNGLEVYYTIKNEKVAKLIDEIII